MRIAEVRRYAPDPESPYPLRNMVAELDAEFLPDGADMRARVRVYEDLYACGWDGLAIAGRLYCSTHPLQSRRS